MMLKNIALNEKSIMGASLALAALIVVTLIYTLVQWQQDVSLISQRYSDVAPAATTNDASNMITSIPDEHLFGLSLTQNGDIPISSLQLQVTGIVKANDQDSLDISKVYISVAGGPSKIYQPGDHLQDQINIYGITKDSVILENKGHFEKLPLARTPLEFKPRPIEDLP